MGGPRVPERAKLIVGLLSADAALFLKIRTILSRAFGSADFESDILDFPYTDYYQKEMGGSIKRRFISFERSLPLDGLYKVKLRTKALERMFSNDGRRMINIDPGYLDLAKVVLFSTKDYSHRIYLNKGVFAEVTLYYKNNTFTAWPWTYPDYRSPAYIGIFNAVRSRYKNQLCRDRR